MNIKVFRRIRLAFMHLTIWMVLVCLYDVYLGALTADGHMFQGYLAVVLYGLTFFMCFLCGSAPEEPVQPIKEM